MLVLAAAGAGCGGEPLSPTGTGGTGAIGGSGGSGGAAGTPGGVPLEMFTAQYAIAFCAPLLACQVFADLSTCRTASGGFEQDRRLLTALGEVARGTVNYDPAAAAACIAALPQDCTAGTNSGAGSDDPGDLFTKIPACAAVFTGTLPAGATCELYSFACAGASSLCLPGSFNCTRLDHCCLGTCQPYNGLIHQVGDSCTDNGLCQAPAICRSTCVLLPAEGAACDALLGCSRLADYCRVDGSGTAGTCVPRLSAGMACTVFTDPAVTGLQIDPCLLDARCTSDGTVDGASHCVPSGALGAACDSSNSCDGLVCTDGACAQGTTGVDCGD